MSESYIKITWNNFENKIYSVVNVIIWMRKE